MIRYDLLRCGQMITYVWVFNALTVIHRKLEDETESRGTYKESYLSPDHLSSSVCILVTLFIYGEIPCQWGMLWWYSLPRTYATSNTHTPLHTQWNASDPDGSDEIIWARMEESLMHNRTARKKGHATGLWETSPPSGSDIFEYCISLTQLFS